MKARIIPVDEAAIHTNVRQPVEVDAYGIPYGDWHGPRLTQESVETANTLAEPAAGELRATDQLMVGGEDGDLPEHHASHRGHPMDPETLNEKVRANAGTLSEGILGRHQDLTGHVARMAVRAAGGPVTQLFTAAEVAQARGDDGHAAIRRSTRADEQSLSWSGIVATANNSRPSGRYAGRHTTRRRHQR